MQITTLAKEVQPYVVEMRRYFHQHPELSNREDKTIQRIAQELTDMDIPYEEIPKGGILATIQGLDPGKGKTVLLRADIDALPVQEQPCNLSQPRVCQSQEDGVMHACGHDGHIAMLLGAAKILSSHREAIHGTVLLLFERGEENGGGDRLYPGLYGSPWHPSRHRLWDPYVRFPGVREGGGYHWRGRLHRHGV